MKLAFLSTARLLTSRAAAMHPSAEQYRARANLIRASVGPATGAEQRAVLLEIASEFERLAAELEAMRMKPGSRSDDGSTRISS